METPSLIGVRADPLAVDPYEVQELSTRYGMPLYRRYDIKADDYMRRHRLCHVPDRRGEVVFAIRQPNGQILLHTKHQYEQAIYRLPSGGINHGEWVEEALYREIAEETGQPVFLRNFLGVLDCHFHYGGESMPFVSYVFYLESDTAQISGSDPIEIAAFRTVPPKQMSSVAHQLRALAGKRRCWGYWRSLAHDLVYERLIRLKRGRGVD